MDLTALVASAATAASLSAADLDKLDADLLAEFDRLEKEPRKTPAVVQDMRAAAEAYAQPPPCRCPP